MADELPAADAKALNDAFQKALDAVGQPGVFGYGQKPADPAAFRAASDAIMAVLRPLTSACVEIVPLQHAA